MNPITLEDRERIIADFDAGVSYDKLRERYGVSVSTIRSLLKLRAETGSLMPRPHGGGQRPKLDSEQQAVLAQLREQWPEAGQAVLAQKLEEACGVRVDPSSICRYLKLLGFVRQRASKPPKKIPPKPPSSAKQVRYRKADLPPAPAHRKPYPSDVTDAEWAIIEPLIPKVKPGGRPEVHPKQEIVNGVFYVLRSGCQWRMLPHDFPPWQTVLNYFEAWSKDGLWERINQELRERVRRKAGREPTPSAAIVDSQSTKTTEKGGPVAMTGQNG